MRRVSSRQRLVSWDAFEANAPSDDEEEFMYGTPHGSMLSLEAMDMEDKNIQKFHSVHGSAHGSLETLVSGEILEEEASASTRNSKKRVREPKSSTLKITSYADVNSLALSVIPSPPTLVPAYRWELSGASSQNKTLDVLHQDVQLYIVSFLDVSSARSFSVSNTQARQLLLCVEATGLWRDWYTRRWPHLSLGGECTTLPTLVDDLNTPTAGGSSFCSQGGVNLSLLLGMASQHLPTRVNEACLKPGHLARLRPRLNGRRRRVDPNQKIFTKLPQPNGRMAIQYVGQVGTGDRSIRSNEPLSSPKFNQDLDDKASFLHKVLYGNACATADLPPWHPFVAPFQLPDGSFNVTPRLISYFEVSILPRPQELDEEDLDRPAVPDCVAVGVATREFSIHSRMPGWDCLSYAYHGDDGAIFHGSGDMERAFGPAFGAGDVVGCGIDYAQGGIFYTLNGKMLGYAWTNIEKDFLCRDLYPTVGVDTNCPVQCNYGERPFDYDLRSMVQQQESVVKECLLASRDTK